MRLPGWGWEVDAESYLLCSPALMAVTWRPAQPRALSMSGVCSPGKWRRSSPSTIGKMSPGSPSEDVGRSCDSILRGHGLFG